MKSIILAIILILISNTVYAGEVCYTEKGYPYAASEKLLDDLMNYIRVKDKDAITRLVYSGLAGISKKGVKVYRVHVGWTGKMEIRPAGATDTVWTLTEAVKCN